MTATRESDRIVGMKDGECRGSNDGTRDVYVTMEVTVLLPGAGFNGIRDCGVSVAEAYTRAEAVIRERKQ